MSGAPLGVLRWAVDSASWEPSAGEFDACLGLLPSEERDAVRRFIKEDDRKRAVVSRLLQRAAVCAVCDVDIADVNIARTKGRKPFTTNAKPHGAPNFNFNVSHEGNFTALAADPLCVVGIDVAAPNQVRRRGGEAFATAIEIFRAQFAPSEWALIQGCAHDEGQMESWFQRLWSLKEAFVKARGDGLGFEPLSRAEFSFTRRPEDGGLDGSSASVAVDGVRQPSWSFELQRLGGDHWVSVARGPPHDIVDAHGHFTATFGRPRLTADEVGRHVKGAPGPAFALLSVAQLAAALGG
ncbi:hypothetical protein FOA52_000044 [Chlamydomonas sp. UWO 241]|nr:hypothetical protein FOA52_000044 [Chlamydomonas sp. UWO 241]